MPQVVLLNVEVDVEEVVDVDDELVVVDGIQDDRNVVIEDLEDEFEVVDVE